MKKLSDFINKIKSLCNLYILSKICGKIKQNVETIIEILLAIKKLNKKPSKICLIFYQNLIKTRLKMN